MNLWCFLWCHRQTELWLPLHKHCHPPCFCFMMAVKVKANHLALFCSLLSAVSLKLLSQSYSAATSPVSLIICSAEVLLKERWRISDLTNSLSSNLGCWLTLSSMGVFTQGPAASVCHPVTSHTCHEVPCVPTVCPWVRVIPQTQLLSSLTKPRRALKVKGNDFVYVVQILFPVCVYILYSSALVSVYLCASVECCITALLSSFYRLKHAGR